MAIGFWVECSKRLLRRSSDGTRNVTGNVMIHQVMEQWFVQYLILSSNSYGQASVFLRSLRVACANHAVLKFSILLFQGNSWALEFVPLDWRCKQITTTTL
jgi:hypothetical protein